MQLFRVNPNWFLKKLEEQVKVFKMLEPFIEMCHVYYLIHNHNDEIWEAWWNIEDVGLEFWGALKNGNLLYANDRLIQLIENTAAFYHKKDKIFLLLKGN